MAPLFFHDGTLTAGTELDLHDDTAKHVVQVLRMHTGDGIDLTDGRGAHARAVIAGVQKKQCKVMINEVHMHERRQVPLHMAITFTKNSSRNEWILEKVTELGITTIIPLQTKRSEREKFRYDRWHNILVAAMIQSQQYFLPELQELTSLDKMVSALEDVEQKLVAHCMDAEPRQPINGAMQKDKETLLLIGPEGDFTDEEVNMLTSKGYKGISMGTNRLRTETAAVTACAYFNMLNHG
ncbi:MAG TPA: RsmE family RNA methyltransferase [Flavipsychrobacter sp.]